MVHRESRGIGRRESVAKSKCVGHGVRIPIDSHHSQPLVSPEYRHRVSRTTEGGVEDRSLRNRGEYFDDFIEHHGFVCPAHQQSPDRLVSPGFLPG
jgi:hypothetical protein